MPGVPIGTSFENEDLSSLFFLSSLVVGDIETDSIMVYSERS